VDEGVVERGQDMADTENIFVLFGGAGVGGSVVGNFFFFSFSLVVTFFTIGGGGSLLFGILL